MTDTTPAEEHDVEHVVRTELGTSTYTGDTCPRCDRPTVMTAPLTMLADDFVCQIGTVTYCSDCQAILHQTRGIA